MSDVSWRARAACRKTDPEIFFPISYSHLVDLANAAEAKKICARCDVTAECLQFALDNGEDHGIWGGLTEDERRALKGRRPRKSRRLPPLGGQLL